MNRVKPERSEFGTQSPDPNRTKEEKGKKFYETFRFDHKQFPELKKLRVGDAVTLTLKGRVTELSISRFDNSTGIEPREYETGKGGE